MVKNSKDIDLKIRAVNYAIAVKNGIGGITSAKTILQKIDWSATIADFKLAEAVVLDDFDLAASLMKQIGKEGELIKEIFYHQWPLFIQFRLTKQFLDAYHEVYGYSFAKKAQEDAQNIAKPEIEKIVQLAVEAGNANNKN